MNALRILGLPALFAVSIASKQTIFCMENPCKELIEYTTIPVANSEFDRLIQLEEVRSPLEGLQKFAQLKEEGAQKLEAAQAEFLKELNFEYIPLEQQQSILSYLADQKVHSLSFKNCSVLNDEALQQLTLTHLKELDIRGCEGTTWQGLLYLSQTALVLEKLNIAGHKSLDKIGNIGTYFYSTPLVFNHLKWFNIDGCTKLAVLHLQTPELEWFSCQYAPLSYDTLTALLQKSPKIGFLDVKGCPKISIIPKLPFNKREFMEEIKFMEESNYNPPVNSKELVIIPYKSSLYNWFYPRNQKASSMWNPRERSMPQNLKVMMAGYYGDNYPQIKRALGGAAESDPYPVIGMDFFSLVHQNYRLQFWELAEQAGFMGILKRSFEGAKAMLLFFNSSKLNDDSLKIFKDYYSQLGNCKEISIEFILLGIGNGTIGDISKIEEFRKEANIRHFICLPSAEKPYQYAYIRDTLCAIAVRDEYQIDKLKYKYDAMEKKEKAGKGW